MLKRIYIHNYRTFVNFEWRPPAVSVLVGPNGAGKSALLEVLCHIQDLVVAGKRVEELGFPSTLTEWRSEAAQTFEIELDGGAETYKYRVHCLRDSGPPFVEEELHGNGQLLYRSGRDGVDLFGNKPDPTPRTTIPFFPRTSFLSALEARADNQRLVRFRELVGSLWSLKPDPLRLGGAAVTEAQWLERDLTNFASWYRARVQEDPDAANDLRSDLQRILQGFDQLRLKPLTEGVKDLSIRFKFGKTAHELSWAKLSDGQRMLIALYGTFRLAFPHAGIIALDEIENFVAPHEIQPWLRHVIDGVSEANHQLFVASHHPESINYLAADSIWRMWRDESDGHSRIEQLEIDRETGETAYEAANVAATTDG